MLDRHSRSASGRGGCCLLLAGRPPFPVRLSAVLADGDGHSPVHAPGGAAGPDSEPSRT